jgi:hypothetical protein
MFRFISTSDEAFVRWVMECKWKKLKEDHDAGKGSNRKFEKPKGAHDSLLYGHRYREIYDEVKRGRTKASETIFNNWFWTYFQAHNPTLFQETSSISQDNVMNSLRASHPDQDEARPVVSFAVTENFSIDPAEV